MNLDEFLQAVCQLAGTQWPGLTLEEVSLRFREGRLMTLPIDPSALRRQTRRRRSGRPAEVPTEVLRLFEATGRRYHLTDAVDALAGRGVSVARRHLERVLTELREEGTVNNGSDSHGKGYGLSVWGPPAPT